MKYLSKKQMMIVAGGSEGNKEQPTGEKVKDVVNDGLEEIGNTMDQLSEKIHVTAEDKVVLGIKNMACLDR